MTSLAHATFWKFWNSKAMYGLQVFIIVWIFHVAGSYQILFKIFGIGSVSNQDIDALKERDELGPRDESSKLDDL